MFEHLIELPDRLVTLSFPCRWVPPSVIHVDGVAYVAVPVVTLADAHEPWRYVAY